MSFFDLVNQDPVANLFGGTLYEAQKPVQAEYEPVSEVGSLLAGTPLSKATIDSERYTDKLKIELANADKARGLTMVDMPVADKLTQISQLQQPVVERGVGDIYSDRNFQGLDPVSKDEVAGSVNYAYEQENATKAFMHSLGAEDYDVYKSPEDILSLPVPVPLLAGASDLEVSKLAGSKGRLMQEEMLKKDFIKINEARRLKGKPPLKLPDDVRKLTVTERLNFTSTGDIPESTEELLNEIIPLDSKNVGTTQVGSQSIKDFLYYSSVYPVNKDVEIEFGNILLQAAGDPEFDLADAIEALDSQVNARYGDESYKMMAALMAREGFEWMAVTKLLKGTGVVKDNSSWAYTTFMNNAVFATVGSEIDRAIDKVFNKESADRLTDYTVRFLGGVIGEGAAKIVGKSVKGALGIEPKPKPPIQAINDVAQTTGQTKAAVDVNNRVLNDVLNPPAGADGLPTNTTSSIVGVPRELVETEVLSNGAVSGVDNALGDAAIIRANKVVEEIPVKVEGKDEKIKTIWYSIDQTSTNLPLIKESTTGLHKKKSAMQVLRYKDALANEVVDPYFSVGANVVDNLGIAENTAGRMKEQMADSIREASKGLSGEEFNVVLETMRKSDELNREFTPSDLLDRGFSKAQIESYSAVRTVLNESGKALDNRLVANYRANGMKKFGDDFVKVVGKGEPNADGMVLVTKKGEGIDKAILVPQHKLEEVTSVLKMRDNYFPVAYDAQYAVSKVNTKTGEFSRVHADKTARGANKMLAKLDADKEEGVMYFMHRWNTARGAIDLGLTDRTQSLMDSLDPATYETVKKMLQSSGVDADSLTYAIDLVNPGAGMYKGVGEGARGANRIGKQLPPADALANYLQRVSNALVHDQWRVDSIAKLDADAKKYLLGGDVYNSSRPLGKRIDPSKATPATQRIADQLHRTEEFIQYTLSGRSTTEKALDARATAIVDDFAKSKNPALQRAAEVLNAIGLDKAVSNTKRFLLTTGYHTRLFANLGTVLSQMAQSVPATGGMIAKSPAAYLHTLYDATDMITRTSISKITGRPVSKRIGAIISEMENAGWLNAKDFTDISDVMSQTDMGTGRSLLNKASDIGAAPIQVPEKLTRYYAYMFARNDMLRELKAGKLNGFNGEFKGKVGDLEWGNLAVRRAKLYALDFSKTGKIGINRGALAPIFQFAQFSFKSFAQMTYDSRLPLRSRLGAYSATALAFGTTNALPFSNDVVEFADYIAKKANSSDDVYSDDNPLDTSPVSDFIKVGFTAYTDDVKAYMNANGMDGDRASRILKAYIGGQGTFDLLTDRELAIAHRVTAASYFSDTIRNLRDFNGSIDPTRLGAGIFSLFTAAQSASTIVDLTVKRIRQDEINTIIEQGGDPAQAGYDKAEVDNVMYARMVVGEVGKAWSAVGYQVRYWANASKPYGGNYETIGNVEYPVGVDDTAMRGILLGAMPAASYLAFRDSDDQVQRAAILKETVNNMVKGYKDTLKLASGNPSAPAVRDYVLQTAKKVKIMEEFLLAKGDTKTLNGQAYGEKGKYAVKSVEEYSRGGLEASILDKYNSAAIDIVYSIPAQLPPVDQMSPEGAAKVQKAKDEFNEETR